MTLALSSLILMGLLALFLGAGVWIFSGLILVGTSAMYFVLDFPAARIGSIATKVISSSAISWELAAIPIFIWMGDIIFRTDISQRLFRGLAPLVARIPGGLLHTNVFGCTIFAAISGSSTATTATVGKITVPELQERGYDINLASGSLAGAGSFGLLIPPSITMIVYGVLAEVSISKLFAAGLVPGLMMAGLYAGYIAIVSLMNPDKAPRYTGDTSFRAMLHGCLELLPIALLMFVVLGSIYSGLATPSEAAAVGVFAAIMITIATRQFSFHKLAESLMSTLRVSAMILMLIAAAAFLSAVIAYLHLPTDITAAISRLDLSPYGVLIILAVLYIILGMFLDGTSMTVMTVPIAVPLVVQAGFDPIWFGIYLIIMIEMSALTPPVGLNLFVLQGLTGHTLGQTMRAAAPFFLLLVLGVIILAIFPEIVLWLPNAL
ncbi:TRAP transporter large permease [Celeribacter litoreus]|uniref:TRAP transporter large permease n=1 Tax=Celeribacter litoreus TaxID=2876714 RepID=UPI001CC99C3D|nr:TRAP transporter large permease subunit [Celeribacter litoreus]MCA0044917.1 TRAP transporter large permease subunit [Celeribacter litoreus]